MHGQTASNHKFCWLQSMNMVQSFKGIYNFSSLQVNHGKESPWRSSVMIP
uniref:Uncharacterized protein n=1 Tax=Arundo donax TaxID=35708 RepID=A0A0A9G0T2_ARUDO